MTAFPQCDVPSVLSSEERGISFSDDVAALSPAEHATLEYLQTHKYEYIDSEVFHLKPTKALAAVFDQAPQIPRADTSWYRPMVDTAVNDNHANKHVGSVILTAEQERALFLQFNYCRFRVVTLMDTLDLEAPEDIDAVRTMLAWHEKAEAYRDQIAQVNLALVLAMAKRMRATSLDFSELVSEGNMALLRAIDKFDAGRGFKFSTYACRAILKSFSRSGMKYTRYRQLFPASWDPTLERSNYQEEKNAAHEDDCVDEVRQIMRLNRAHLSEVETEVIKCRFALGDGAGQSEPPTKPMTLEQVGRVIGVTKERVRQIQNKALVKIRHALEHDFLE